jgi:DNA-binding PadR family transcriptional regulator
VVKRGRISIRERGKAISGLIQALEKHPEGLGVRELRRKSGIKSLETLYKYLPELERTKAVEFHEKSIGRGKPKKIYRLSKKGLAHSVEFKIIDHFEKIRESCEDKNQFEIDNYAFSYVIYGLPKNMDHEERETAAAILRKLNLDLLELDEFRYEVINKEPLKYRRAMTAVLAKIGQYVSKQNKERKLVILDTELWKEINSCFPSSIREKMMPIKNGGFAVLATRGPSFIDEYSLRPENYLLGLMQAVEGWDDDGMDAVVRQLAKNRHVNQEAIERLKAWDKADGRISDCDWQKIKERLDDIPKIREEMKRDREKFIQSGSFRHVLGLKEGASLVVTKEMLGRRKLNALKKELSDLGHAQRVGCQKS